MADNTVAGFGKDPLATSHGDALADQSFESLKSKEIRDSLSPTEMKFQSMALNNPNNTGWNVQSSKEITPDGRGFRAETIATTDGVEHINGGTAEFKGRNEQRSSAHHQGDDKNFIKKAMESANSHLQEKVVIGDENSGRTEVRTSSSTSTSSSQVFQSSTNVEYEDGIPIQQNQPQKYLMDSTNRHYQPHELQQRQLHEEQRIREEQRLYEQQFKQQHQQQQHERRTSEQMISTQRQNTEQKNVTQNVQTQETHEQNKRYVDLDKASPEYQQHVQHLMQQPGEIISNTVEYPKPNVKMITTVKRLPDGTIVRNKRYETEEVAPSGGPSSNRPVSSVPDQTQIRRDSQQPQPQPGQPGRYYQPDVAAHSPQRPNEDMVDSATTTRYVHDSHNDDVETKITSSVKKSSRKFSTETTSETIQGYDDRYPHGGEPSTRPRPQQTNDFSTHGFPSVRPNKPTQEYPSERPRPSPHYTNQAAPKPNEAVVPHDYTDDVDNVSKRRIPTNDGGEIIVVTSEKKRNFKTESNSERIVETEHIVKDDQQDFTTQGFPSVREPVHQPKMYPSDRQVQAQEQDFPLDKYPLGARITRPSSQPADDDTVVVSTQKSQTSKYNTNTERVIEHEIISDDHGYPRLPQQMDNMPYTVTTPGDQQPQGQFPGSPRKPSNVDYSTQGFPSVRTPTKGDHTPHGDYPGSPRTTPAGSDFTTQGFPSTRTPSKPAAGYPSSPQQEYLGSPKKLPTQGYSTQGFPSVRTPAQGHPSNGTAEPNRTSPSSKTQQPFTPSPNKYKTPSSSSTTTRETTERVIRKEKEVDSAHRAFAASLRSSSPMEPVRRDSHTTDSHTRHTPRSSISSVKTYRRDMREGSHDSAPSETSRFSTTTVTRNTPPRTLGGRTVVTRVVTTKTGLGSNDSLTKTSSRGTTKSPSPGKTVTTTTTTTTTRTGSKAPTPSRDVPKSTEPSSRKPSQYPHQPRNNAIKMSTTTTMDSVAARRTLFENNSYSGQSTPTKRTPATSPMSGRRPSYMDHTKSSLEHTRRDSLEVNKTHYSRKPSQLDDDVHTTDRNSTVKFDMPHGKRPSVQRPASINEEIDVEAIFDVEILEKLLETVQSYEIRRRIRAQIRLIKKNQKNELISQTEVVTTKVSPSKGIKPTTSSTTEETVVDTTAVSKKETKQTATKKEYIFEEAILPPSRKTPQSKRYGHEKEPTPKKSTRQHSPDLLDEQVSTTTSTSQKQSYYQDNYQQQEFSEITHESSSTRHSPTRKPTSLHSSPDRHYSSPESKSPVRNHQRSRSPQSKPSRKTSAHSPDNKTSPSRSKSSTTSSTTVTSTTNKPTTKRTTTTTSTTTTTAATNGAKSHPNDVNSRTPVWADRKNILKAPGTTTTPKKSATPSSVVDTRSGYSKSIKSKTSQKQITHKSSFVDDDCVTSSYGIGPTDENGLPLFGIRALKKKKPQVEPSETTEEVTGYVVEEKYYSDSKTKPTVERKEFIYSTNPEELEKLKEQVEITSSTIKSLKDIDVKETRQAALISKSAVKGATPVTAALRSSPEDDFLDKTTKYVRRGSVKEMSEKFIQKEASSTLTEKTKNYPKAGLILRTNSRKNSRDNDNEGDNYETFKTTRIQHHSTALGDSDGGGEHEYEVEEVASRHSGRFITESESECESIKTQREFKKVTSSSSSSMATRSFLNSQGDERVITNVSDCLERMRNADNVVEEGDTAEDQEARALLNKFLGASIIMKGVESSIPAASSSNRQSKIITTTTTSSNLSDDYDDDNTAKHEIKTTRITKTIKSGDSSTPVTYTTCDIEEIWDEEILKELLEQAKTYEERRKIRSRLRELMADREEQKQQQKLSSSTTEKTETKEKDGAVVTTTTKVTTRTVTGTAAKPVSPFNKFKQLDSQQQSAKSPTSPTTPGRGNTTASPTASGGNQPIFKFTDPALNARAATVKEQLLQWCQSKTQEYENVQITNFSTSWNNGLAFCALIHHFLPDAFDYSQLTPKNRRKNFELAFTVADEKAGIAPLLDVEDMVVMQRPDWKCVFVYVQSIYRRFRNCQ